jgi:hypothetical protein
MYYLGARDMQKVMKVKHIFNENTVEKSPKY